MFLGNCGEAGEDEMGGKQRNVGTRKHRASDRSVLLPGCAAEGCGPGNWVAPLATAAGSEEGAGVNGPGGG